MVVEFLNLSALFIQKASHLGIDEAQDAGQRFRDIQFSQTPGCRDAHLQAIERQQFEQSFHRRFVIELGQQDRGLLQPAPLMRLEHPRSFRKDGIAPLLLPGQFLQVSAGLGPHIDMFVVEPAAQQMDVRDAGPAPQSIHGESAELGIRTGEEMLGIRHQELRIDFEKASDRDGRDRRLGIAR